MEYNATPTIERSEEVPFIEPTKIDHGLANLMSVLDHAIRAGDLSNALRAKDGLVEFITNGYVARDTAKTADVEFRFPEPQNKTEGLANFVTMAQVAIRDERYDEAMLLLVDLSQDVGSVYVCDDVAQTVLGDVAKLAGDPGKDMAFIERLADRAIEIYRAPHGQWPIPAYDPKTDGNYSTWLAHNNID